MAAAWRGDRLFSSQYSMIFRNGLQSTTLYGMHLAVVIQQLVLDDFSEWVAVYNTLWYASSRCYSVVSTR